MIMPKKKKILIILLIGCEDELLLEQAAHSQITYSVLIMFFISMLGIGIGQTAVSTLGIPFIDDNVASRESPIYIGKFLNEKIIKSTFKLIIFFYS